MKCLMHEAFIYQSYPLELIVQLTARLNWRCSLFTIGHSTRLIEEFLDLLDFHQIKTLVDVRSIPQSKHNPQFNRDAVSAALAAADISYTHRKELGGLRRPAGDSINKGWKNTSFRGFADYMQTNDFWKAIDDLLHLSEDHVTALMCAELLPWRCHRLLISDGLFVRGISIEHIINKKSVYRHKLTSFAVADGVKVFYPAPDEAHQ